MKTSLVFLPIILFTSFIASSFGFFNTGYSIQDLMDDTQTGFETDAALWLITPTPCATCSLTYQTDINTCYSQSNLMLGGPGILSSGSSNMIAFQRTYKNLSTHTHVVFSINISYFGSKTTVPTGQPVVNLIFDGQIVNGPRITTSDACAVSTSPTIMLTNFQGVVAHTSSSLTLVIQTLFPFQQIQVGFRQVSLLLYTSTPAMPTADSPVCQSSIVSNAYQYDECSCRLGLGYLIFGTCWPCISPCSTCFFTGTTGASSCYTCKDGYFWSGGQCVQTPPGCASYSGTYCSSCTSGFFYYGNGVCQASCDPDVGYYPIQVLSISYCFTKCPVSNPYRYINGSCLGSCASPLTNLSTSVNNISLYYCFNPCSSSQYLYPDGTCNTTCATPLRQITIGGIPYCQSPCSDSSQLYSTATSSCLSSCPSPLVASNVQGILYCSNPCPASQYLFTNGSCFSTCLQPLTLSPGIIGTYCINLCSTTDYLYPNKSCSDSCPSPLASRQEPGVKYCFNPCQSSQYLYSNGSCLSTCPVPLASRSEPITTFCDNPCSIHDYLYPNGSCFSDCQTPLASRQEPGVKYCFDPCHSLEYLYANGSCVSTCPAPLASRSEPITTFCDNPCSIHDFLYPNGSCFANCQTPLVSRQEPNVKYCFNPCQSSQYLYPNGSCLSTCPTPLTSRSEPITTFCNNPCSNDEFLYSNGTCIKTCPSPLVSIQEPGADYCFNPCQPLEYLYSNGSCLNLCESPFAIRSEPDVKYCSLLCADGYLLSNGTCISDCNSPFKKRIQQDTALVYCDSPCSNSADYYYPNDGSCQSQCEYPNQIASENGLLQTCTLMVTESEAKQAKALAKTATVTNSISSGGMVAGSLLSSGDSTSAAMGSLTKMLSYIKFMNIKFPPKLQLLFDSSSSNSSLLSSIPNNLRDKTGNLPPPTNFQKYNVSSSFIINFWQSLVILGIILIVIFTLLIFSVLMKRCTAVANIIQKILSALRWNTFLTLFCSYCGDIVLFSALEFQTVQSDNVITALSFTLCVGINILMGYTLYKILTVNLSVRKIQKDKTTEEDIEKTFGDYKTFFECYKGDSYLQQIFMFVFMIRVGLFNGIIGYLYPYPLVQAILIILINTGILIYLLFKRPMRKMINLVQQILLEAIIFVFNIGVFILAILDAEHQENESMRENIGDMLIMINVIVPILAMVLIAIKILLIMWEFYQNYKKSKAQVNQKLPKISIRQTRAPSHSSQNASPVLQFRETASINMSFTTDQTSHNLLRTNFNNNNKNSLLFVENFHSSLHLHHINSPQRNHNISYQSSTPGNGQLDFSTLNLSSIEETYHDLPRNMNPIKRIERRNPPMKRITRGPRSRQFVNNIISFDPQIDK